MRHQPQIQTTSFARGSPPVISNPIAVTLSLITLAFLAQHKVPSSLWLKPTSNLTHDMVSWLKPTSYLTHTTVWLLLWHNPLYSGDQPATSHTTRCGRRCGTTHCMVGANQLPHTQHGVVVAVAQPTVRWWPTSYYLTLKRKQQQQHDNGDGDKTLLVFLFRLQVVNPGCTNYMYEMYMETTYLAYLTQNLVSGNSMSQKYMNMQIPLSSSIFYWSCHGRARNIHIRTLTLHIPKYCIYIQQLYTYIVL